MGTAASPPAGKLMTRQWRIPETPTSAELACLLPWSLRMALPPPFPAPHRGISLAETKWRPESYLQGSLGNVAFSLLVPVQWRRWKKVRMDVECKEYTTQGRPHHLKCVVSQARVPRAARPALDMTTHYSLYSRISRIRFCLFGGSRFVFNSVLLFS